jgi:hypothetical protein
MTTTEFKIGQEVVRSKGDYVVGRIGIIIALDSEKNRAQVKWESYFNCTWVSCNSIELTSIPYEIIPAYLKKNTGNYTNPKYKKLV